MAKTNGKHYTLFKSECEYWINRFGLTNYDLSYSHSNLLDDADVCAFCKSEEESKDAILALTMNWDELNVTEYQIRKFAFHEVCELLYAPSEDMAEFFLTRIKKLDHSFVDRQRHIVKHELINRLVRSLFDPSLKERGIKLNRFNDFWVDGNTN